MNRNFPPEGKFGITVKFENGSEWDAWFHSEAKRDREEARAWNLDNVKSVERIQRR